MFDSNHQTGWSAIAVEGLGALLLVLIAGAVPVVYTVSEVNLGLMGIALAGGLVLVGLVLTLAGVSGAHFNPVVTWAAVVCKRISITTALSYSASQLIGAICAGLALNFLLAGAITAEVSLPILVDSISWVNVVVAEAGAAFVWVLVIGASVWEGHRIIGSLALGLVHALSIFVLGFLTGGEGNPASALGAALAAGQWMTHPAYWLGPVIGAGIGAILVALIFRKSAPEVESMEDPQQARSYFRQGVSLYRRGRLEEAAQQLALATECQPKWPEPYYYIGIIYRDYGDETNAGAFFDAAMQLRSELRDHQPRWGV